VLPRGYSEARKNTDNSVQLKKKDNNPEGEAGEQDPGVPEDRRQKTEDRRQKTEGRRQKAEGRRQKAEGRRQKPEGRSQKTGDRGQGTGDRGQGAEDGKRVTLPGCHGQR
jgi:hypothetical protein